MAVLFIRLINSAVHSADLHAALVRMDTFLRHCGSGHLAGFEGFGWLWHPFRHVKWKGKEIKAPIFDLGPLITGVQDAGLDWQTIGGFERRRALVAFSVGNVVFMALQVLQEWDVAQRPHNEAYTPQELALARPLSHASAAVNCLAFAVMSCVVISALLVPMQRAGEPQQDARLLVRRAAARPGL